MEPCAFGGPGKSTFTLTCRDTEGMAAILSNDETRIAEAYIRGRIDIEGEMLDALKLRNQLSDRHPLMRLWMLFGKPLLRGQERCDREWIASHYDYDQEFYLLFLDKRYRAYSQGIFESESESLEAAIERKLEFAFKSCRLAPGQRVLDIGGGWGAFVDYAGKRGVHVTSLTISKESAKFLNDLIAREKLECEVRQEHFFAHAAPERYDAIVNLGVTEHLPDYRRTIHQYLELLKPGGRVYLDASACREKFAFSSYIYRYIYPGNSTPMCLEDYLAEVERSPFEIMEIQNDRESYERTVRHWARRLDEAHDEIARRWGEPHFRKFRLYLWGTAHAFASNLMSAYRLVLELPRTRETLGRWRD
jgi:cyclopropane-fatty-acyl-phospholipid synthase